MKEDSVIIKDILRNREKVVEELYDRYAPSLLSLCYRYAGNMQDAEDILHDGFIKIIKNLPEFRPRPDGSLEAWMKRIMINNALNFLRDHAKEKKQLDLDAIQDRLNINEESSDFDFDLAHLPVTQDQILRMIGELPAGYRTVFNLYVFEEYSHKEICKQMNCTESTSKSQLSKARAVLRSKIYETVNILNTR
jgi:RNA polymerase sigma-70 factor, ECF subfamily